MEEALDYLWLRALRWCWGQFHMSHDTIQAGPTVSTLPPLPSLSLVLSTEPQKVLT